MAFLFSKLKCEGGIGKFTFLVFGSLIAAVVFYGYNVGPFYYDYYEIVQQMESVIRVAQTEDDVSIRRKLMYHIKKLGLPVRPDELVIERGDRYMKISLPYREVFYVTYKGRDYILQTFDFNAHAEGPF